MEKNKIHWNKRIKKINIVVIVVAVLLFLLAYRSLLWDLINGIDDIVFRCSDIWKYYTQTLIYMAGGKLKDIIEFWNEPGWFINTSNLNLISDFSDARVWMILMVTIIFLLSSTLLFIFVSRIAPHQKSMSVVGLVLFILSFPQNVSYYFQARQTFANFILLTLIFIICCFYKKGGKKLLLVGGMLLWAIIISHRAVGWLTLGCLGLLIISAILIKKYNDAKRYIVIITLSLLFIIPFLYISRYDYYNTIYWLFNRSYSGTEQNAIYTTLWDTQLWFSLVRLGYNNNIPLLDYVLFFPLWILALWFFWVLKKRMPYQLSVFFIALTLYLTWRNFFGNRMVGTFEPVLFLFLLINMSFVKFKKFKIFVIITAIFIFLIHRTWFIYGRDLSDSKIQNSINLILEKVPKEKAFIVWSWCAVDLFQQLDYSTELNYPRYPVAHIEKLKTEGIFMTPNQLTNFWQEYWQFIAQGRSEIIPSFLKDKDIYLVLGKRWDSKQIYALNQKMINDPQIQKEVEVIFVNSEVDKLVAYILKVTKSPLYFDNDQYYKSILKTIKEFN